MKRKKGILVKLVAMCVLPMAVMGIIIAVYATTTLRSGMQYEALLGLNNLCQAVASSYDAIDSGDYYMDEDSLYKGNYCITENEDVIDSYTTGSKADVTIFYNDTRRATSLRDSGTGQRILGTKASDEVIETVLKHGEDYSATNITVNNKKYYAYYKPLKNSNGEIVGMIFAGEPSADVDSSITKQALSIGGISLAILIIAMVVCILLVKNMAAIFVQASGMIGNVSNGDLDFRLNNKQEKIDNAALKRTDEIGDMVSSIHELINKLRSMVGSIKSTTDNLLLSGESLETMASQTNATADEISRAVEDIAKGAVSQAEDLQSATTEINNMGDMIEQIFQKVKALGKTSDSIKNTDNESHRIVEELSVSNDKTFEAVEEIDKSVQTTNESVKRIQDAVDLITQISKETSLLALNASIEAARAGDTGKGFAVVAARISKLSEDSKNTAKTIEDIICQLASDSKNSVEIMLEVKEIISLQQEKLEATKEKFDDVSSGIVIFAEETGNIFEQAKECDSARSRVTEIIRNLSAVAESNAASTQETNASMEELNATINLLADCAKDLKDMAEKLQDDVSYFDI